MLRSSSRSVGEMANVQSDTKLFVGGLSWNTTAAKLESYFSNFGQVLEAFVSYDRVTGRPRGFGFVIFEDPAVADRVASQQHTIDRREVEAKKAIAKEDNGGIRPRNSAGQAPQRTKKVFVGGLAPTVDELALRQFFEQFGAVEDAVVMYDHESKRPRGFGFVTFMMEDTVDQVFMAGPLQALHDKQIEIKRAVPRDQMPQPRSTGIMMMRPPAYSPYPTFTGGRPMYAAPYSQAPSYPSAAQGQYVQQGYGAHPYRVEGGMHAGGGAQMSSSHSGLMAGMSSSMAGGGVGGLPMGGLGGGLNSGTGMGAYAAGGGMAGGFTSGIGSSGHSLGLGNLGGPMGSIAGLSGGTAYSLGGTGTPGNFNMAALQGALPSSGLNAGDAAQPSSGASGGVPGYSGGQGMESYPAATAENYGAGNEGIYGSLGPQDLNSSHLNTYASGSGGESYGVAGGLGAAAPGDARDGSYKGGGTSPPIGSFNAATSGFTASAQHTGGQGDLGSDAYMSRPFIASLAASGGLGPCSAPGLASQAPVSGAFGSITSSQVPVSSAFSGLGATQPSISSVFSASSFTELPLAWS